MLWGWVGFFFPYDIHILRPLFILLAQPYKAIACAFIAMQMLLDLISFSASHAAVSTLTNCSYSVMCILQLYEAQAEQSQSSNYKMVQLFSERYICDGLLLTLFTTYLPWGRMIELLI